MPLNSKQRNKIIIVIMVITLIVFGCYQYSIRDYVTIEAQVVGKGTEIGNKTRNTSTYVYYEYAMDGVPVTGKVPIQFQVFHNVGDIEMLRVNPREPDKIANKSVMYVVIFVTGFCIFMLGNNVRQERKHTSDKEKYSI